MGWSTYFAFIFAAINTLTVTYFLAIENYPILSQIFPTFVQYVIIISTIGVPILVTAGYLHYKKTSAFKAEADINIEANPHMRRILTNSDLLLSSYLKLIELIPKITNQEKLSEDEIKELSSLQKSIQEQIDKRTQF
tara:strand:- start:52 stop:462 length:411 start_codon:yes stop_codon:yes gene_type:complete